MASSPTSAAQQLTYAAAPPPPAPMPKRIALLKKLNRAPPLPLLLLRPVPLLPRELRLLLPPPLDRPALLHTVGWRMGPVAASPMPQAVLQPGREAREAAAPKLSEVEASCRLRRCGPSMSCDFPVVLGVVSQAMRFSAAVQRAARSAALGGEGSPIAR